MVARKAFAGVVSAGDPVWYDGAMLVANAVGNIGGNGVGEGRNVCGNGGKGNEVGEVDLVLVPLLPQKPLLIFLLVMLMMEAEM